MTDDLRVATGQLTAAALTADAGSVIADWPSDLPDGWVIGWTMAQPFTRISEGMNGVRRGRGLINFEWVIGRMDSDMLDTLRAELFPDGILTNPSVTVRTIGKGWEGGTQAITVNCYVSWDGLRREFLNPKAGDLFSNVRLRFFNGVIAASGV